MKRHPVDDTERQQAAWAEIGKLLALLGFVGLALWGVLR